MTFGYKAQARKTAHKCGWHVLYSSVYSVTSIIKRFMRQASKKVDLVMTESNTQTETLVMKKKKGKANALPSTQLEGGGGSCMSLPRTVLNGQRVSWRGK